MTFEQALQKNPAPQGVGPLRLRYEAGLLIAERRRQPSVAAGVALATAAACALGAVVEMTADTGNLWMGCALGAGAAGLTAASIASEQRARSRRGFVLNFATEMLRVEQPTWPWGRARTSLIPFDQIRALHLSQGRREAALELDFEGLPGSPSRVTLAEALPLTELEAARTLERVLRTAFGLTSPSVGSPS